MARNALGLEFGSAARLSKRPGSVLNCLWGNALKRSPGIIRKSRVSYPGPGFLSSATWPSLPKKHYNGLNKLHSVVGTLECLAGMNLTASKRKPRLLNDNYIMYLSKSTFLSMEVCTVQFGGGWNHFSLTNEFVFTCWHECNPYSEMKMVFYVSQKSLLLLYEGWHTNIHFLNNFASMLVIIITDVAAGMNAMMSYRGTPTPGRTATTEKSQPSILIGTLQMK